MLKRTVLAVVVLSAFTSPQSQAGVHEWGHPNAEWRMQRCRYQTVDKGKWTVREVDLTINCAVVHFPVSYSTAHYVADRESNHLWFARNAYSGACGIYQHLPRYWASRVSEFTKAHPHWDLGRSCYNARSNILVAIRMAHRGGWGPWGM